MPPWMLVTPASRGIGLALAQRLFNTTTLPLVATARHNLDQTRAAILSAAPSTADESRLTVLQLDVTDEPSIEAAASHCRSQFPSSKDQPSYLHAAFVLPGILHPEKSPAQLDADKILATLRVNTLGPLLMLKHFAGFLPRKATPVQLEDGDAPGVLPPEHAVYVMNSARVGSIADNKTVGGWYSYRASKAALNQVVRTFDNYLYTAAGPKALSMGYHPGTVKTDLSRDFWANVSAEKLFSTEFAVDKMLEVVSRVESRAGEMRGRCWDWKGEEVPP